LAIFLANIARRFSLGLPMPFAGQSASAEKRITGRIHRFL
jgi:hypothetical protein